MAVPGREASEAARFSVEGDAEERAAACDAHAAHLIVATHSADADRISALGEHTRMTAAVALAAEAIAVYDGASRATYSPGFYGSIAAEDLPLPLWTGLSAGAEADGRLSFVSLGMGRLELPDIVVAAPMERADEAYSFLFSLCEYMITCRPRHFGAVGAAPSPASRAARGRVLVLSGTSPRAGARGRVTTGDASLAIERALA